MIVVLYLLVFKMIILNIVMYAQQPQNSLQLCEVLVKYVSTYFEMNPLHFLLTHTSYFSFIF